MNKLTINHAAFAPLWNHGAVALWSHGAVALWKRGAAALGDGGAVAPVVAFRAPAPVAARRLPQRRALHCVWTKDAAGHLACAWSDAPPIDEHSRRWRGASRATAAMLMAA